jgi:hypothetical protein
VALVCSAVGLHAAESEIFTGTAATGTPSKQPGYKSYDYTEADHKFRLVVPEYLAVVRGILVVGPYSGGDSRPGSDRTRTSFSPGTAWSTASASRPARRAGIATGM